MAGRWPYISTEHRHGNVASKSARGRTRAQRLETRVTAEQSADRTAAALQRRTVTDFVLTSLQDAARRAIEQHHQLDSRLRDSDALIDALLEPEARQ